MRAARIRGSELRDEGALSEAREELLRALAMAESGPAPDPLELVALLNDLGLVGKSLGEFDEAAAAYRRALSVLDDGEAADHQGVRASLLHNVAGLAHARGDAVAAESVAREGIALRQHAADAHPPDLASDLAALAAILVDLGQTGEARELLADALAAFEDGYGPEHYEVGVVLHNLGSLEYRLGDFMAAVRSLHRAVRIKEQELGPDHHDLAITLHNLACAQTELGHYATATRSFEQAISLLTGVVATSHPTLASCRVRLERLAHRTKGKGPQ